MTIFRKIIQNIVPIIIISFAVIFTYWDLPKTFFQQDEWLGFARMISYEATGGVENVLKIPFILGKGHFTPLSYYQLYFEFKLFGLSFEPFVLVSIFTHIVNSVLLFYFVSLLLKNKFLALCSALVFAVGVISNQAVSWIGTSTNTQGAILFLLLSLIFILKYFHNNQKINYHIALFFFFTGLLFKETILFFFILAPIMWFLFGDKIGRREFYLFMKPLIFLGFIYLLLRASLFLIPSSIGVTSANTVNLSLTADVVRLIFAPFKIIPQAIIPQQYLINISDMALFYLYRQYGFPNPYISQTVLFGQVIPYLSIPIILIGFIFYKLALLKKIIDLARSIIFSLVFIMLSSLPFAFIPGDLADFPMYESRHLHAATIGVSVFLVVVLWTIVKGLVKKSKHAYLVMLILLVSLLLFHFNLTRTEIYKVVNVSTARRNISDFIKMSYPKLPQKVVFYTESNTSYYGMPQEEKALPVQINFGLILLVTYNQSSNFPPCLFDFDHESFHMLNQRYEECDGRGFGYFRDYDKLVNAVKENNISMDNIISFSWNGKEGEIRDITSEIKERVRKEP